MSPPSLALWYGQTISGQWWSIQSEGLFLSIAAATRLVPEYLSLLEKIENQEASAEQIARFREVQQERTRTILHADTESLFKIEEVSPEIPPGARIVASEICHFCGELTKIDLLREIDGRKACIPCAHGIIGTVNQ